MSQGKESSASLSKRMRQTKATKSGRQPNPNPRYLSDSGESRGDDAILNLFMSLCLIVHPFSMQVRVEMLEEGEVPMLQFLRGDEVQDEGEVLDEDEGEVED